MVDAIRSAAAHRSPQSWATLPAVGKYVTSIVERAGLHVTHEADGWEWRGPQSAFVSTGLWPPSAPWTFIKKRHLRSSKGVSGTLYRNDGEIVMRGIEFFTPSDSARSNGSRIRAAHGDGRWRSFVDKILQPVALESQEQAVDSQRPPDEATQAACFQGSKSLDDSSDGDLLTLLAADLCARGLGFETPGAIVARLRERAAQRAQG